MPVLGITGGIATGKSSFTRRLSNWLAATVFDADAVARELLETDSAARSSVLEAFGNDILETNLESTASAVPGNSIDRSRLRDIVFRNPSERRKLEGILHPAIRSRWVELAESFRHRRSWLFVDIPLLFETGAESAFDTVVVVACAAKTQRDRIVAGRGLAGEIADRMIGSQQSLESKITRAEHVIWTDCPPNRTDEEAMLIAGYLKERYG